MYPQLQLHGFLELEKLNSKKSIDFLELELCQTPSYFACIKIDET
uniref:Uncharacterized protein n=1 Tax=Arundo donax TaxID=35708 RepID=A0A0A9ESF1_ARUDO